MPLLWVPTIRARKLPHAQRGGDSRLQNAPQPGASRGRSSQWTCAPPAKFSTAWPIYCPTAVRPRNPSKFPVCCGTVNLTNPARFPARTHRKSRRRLVSGGVPSVTLLRSSAARTSVCTAQLLTFRARPGLICRTSRKTIIDSVPKTRAKAAQSVSYVALSSRERTGARAPTAIWSPRSSDRRTQGVAPISSSC